MADACKDRAERIRERFEALGRTLRVQDAVVLRARAWLGLSEAEVDGVALPAGLDELLDRSFERAGRPDPAAPPIHLSPHAVRA